MTFEEELNKFGFLNAETKENMIALIYKHFSKKEQVRKAIERHSSCCRCYKADCLHCSANDTINEILKELEL